MIKRNACLDILTENAKTMSERSRIYALTENEQSAVNNAMVANLYKSAIDKSHVDFEDIPDSRGNILRYSGYVSMKETLTTIRTLASKNEVKIPEIDIVEQAIGNIVGARDTFEKGFALNKDFIILQYNTLVYACVEATSNIILSYVDFIKRPDRSDFTIIRDKHRGGFVSITNLEKFNTAFRTGDFSKANNAIITSGKQNLVGIDDIMLPLLIVGAVIAIVPLVRELIFVFYYSRMRLSDYLSHQASLLEINKLSVESGSAPAKKKSEILKKQNEAIAKFQNLSDKIKVSSVTSERKASEEMKKENKGWSIDTVSTQAASTDSRGFQLL